MGSHGVLGGNAMGLYLPSNKVGCSLLAIFLTLSVGLALS